MPTDRKYRVIVRGELSWTDLSKMEQLAMELKRVFETFNGREPEITVLKDESTTAPSR